MATKASPVHRITSRIPAMSTVSLDALLSMGTTARRLLSTEADARSARPRIGMLCVPLAMIGALVAGQWWAVAPLVVCAWWWTPRTWGWEWLSAVGRGAVGAEWAYIGASALASFPRARLIVGVVWVGPVTLAARQALRKPSKQYRLPPSGTRRLPVGSLVRLDAHAVVSWTAQDEPSHL
jgi:hypothetical protein